MVAGGWGREVADERKLQLPHQHARFPPAIILVDFDDLAGNRHPPLLGCIGHEPQPLALDAGLYLALALVIDEARELDSKLGARLTRRSG